MTTVKARKGDLVVLEVPHSSTSVKLKTERWSTFEVALAGKVGRDGTVKSAYRPEGYPLPRTFTEREVERYRVHVVSGHDGAEVIRHLRRCGELSFKTLDDAKATIRAVLVDMED